MRIAALIIVATAAYEMDARWGSFGFWIVREVAGWIIGTLAGREEIFTNGHFVGIVDVSARGTFVT